MVSAALLIVGSEMVDPGRRDANGPYARLRLMELGISLGFIARVEDSENAIASALQAALASYDVVIASGGLGPTGDDVTREAAARLFKSGVREDAGWMAVLEKRLSERGRPLTRLGRRQAMVVEGAEALANNAGLACGNWLERDGKIVSGRSRQRGVVPFGFAVSGPSPNASRARHGGGHRGGSGRRDASPLVQ